MSYPSDSLARTPSHPTLAPGPLLAEAVQPAEGSGGAGLRWPRRPDAGADLPLVDVANAVTAAARGLVPSCTAALVIKVGQSWQVLSQSGQADVIGYHRRQLAALDLGRCGVVLTERHLVAGLKARSAPMCLLLVAAHGREVPERAPELLHSMLECAAEKLDAAAALQHRDRALRRLELLRVQGDGDELRSVRDLERLVASLWPLSTVRYLSRDAALGLERRLRRVVGEACTSGSMKVDTTSDDTSLRPVDWTHRVAVPVTKQAALLIEPAAAGEALDEESVAAAAVVARIWALVERQQALEADLRSLRQEDRETGCLTGTSLPRRLDGALQSAARRRSGGTPGVADRPAQRRHRHGSRGRGSARLLAAAGSDGASTSSGCGRGGTRSCSRARRCARRGRCRSASGSPSGSWTARAAPRRWASRCHRRTARRRAS